MKSLDNCIPTYILFIYQRPNIIQMVFQEVATEPTNLGIFHIHVATMQESFPLIRAYTKQLAVFE